MPLLLPLLVAAAPLDLLVLVSAASPSRGQGSWRRSYTCHVVEGGRDCVWGVVGGLSVMRVLFECVGVGPTPVQTDTTPPPPKHPPTQQPPHTQTHTDTHTVCDVCWELG